MRGSRDHLTSRCAVFVGGNRDVAADGEQLEVGAAGPGGPLGSRGFLGR